MQKIISGSKIYDQTSIVNKCKRFLELQKSEQITQTEFARCHGIDRRLFGRMIAEYKLAVAKSPKAKLNKVKSVPKVDKRIKYPDFAPVPAPAEVDDLVIKYARIGSDILVSTSIDKSKVYKSDTAEYKAFVADIDAFGMILPETYRKFVEVGYGKSVILSLNIKIQDRKLFYCGIELPANICNIIIDQHSKGQTSTGLIKFLERCLSYKISINVIDQLHRFIVSNNITLSESGEMTLYKRVNNDELATDCYTSTVPNLIGTRVTMEKFLVHEDPNKTCEQGLHVCSIEYLKGGGFGNGNSLDILVKVKPEHVVSIPVDYQDSKMRCCEYEVISFVTKRDPRFLSNEVIGHAEVGARGLISYTKKD